MKPAQILEKKLNWLYEYYSSREYVHPDPLEFLYNYSDIHDREIAALIASSLAYGRVAQILKSVSIILDTMGPSPFSYITASSEKEIAETFKSFKHRFTTGDEMSAMLIGIKRILDEDSSLYESFLSKYRDDDIDIIPALSCFAEGLKAAAGSSGNSLLPSPHLGSACKRLNLFLRWMVREDSIDPGGWHKIPASKLIIPLDTHMHRIGLALEMTKRKQADIKTAVEITQSFRRINPKDPVKYDFALTRLGIRKDAELDEFLNSILHFSPKPDPQQS